MTSMMASSGNPRSVRSAREARALSQSALARGAGISRQALGAIEAGAYQPSVAVALRLARVLGESVEALFGARDEFDRVEAELAAPPMRRERGARVGGALARVGGRLVAVPEPAAGLSLRPAAGIVERLDGRRAAVETFRSAAEIDATLLVAGCDPAVAILADWIARRHAAIVVGLGLSSASALSALNQGRVHAAGVHIRDPKSGDYNLKPARHAMGHRKTKLVNFARWELGIATAPGNPLGLSGFADLARPGLRIVNREVGSGARAALDEAVHEAKLNAQRIAGYDRELAGHLEVASAVAAGEADTGVTIRVAADTYGLGFVAIREERYDLAIPEREFDSPPVRAMLDALNSARFAHELSELCAYDTRDMGKVIARIG